jgi:replication initiation and membrane attachment protein DnaB
MTELEPQVISTLMQMVAKYQLLDELTQAMLVQQQQGNSIETELEAMHRQREELIKIERDGQPVNEAYRNSRPSASAEVRRLTDQIATLIQSVIEKVGKLEDSARDSYRQLIPEIDQSVRGTQMKQAYGKSG